jgi:hypothetical protein
MNILIHYCLFAFLCFNIYYVIVKTLFKSQLCEYILHRNQAYVLWTLNISRNLLTNQCVQWNTDVSSNHFADNMETADPWVRHDWPKYLVLLAVSRLCLLHTSHHTFTTSAAWTLEDLYPFLSMEQQCSVDWLVRDILHLVHQVLLFHHDSVVLLFPDST